MKNEGQMPLVAVMGNPNSGKSSLFNELTGLRQEVSNFPGVTVDIKTGACTLDDGTRINVVDFPGTYSLYPNSSDEKIVVSVLLNPDSELFPDLILYVADVTQLERHMLLASQLRDLGIPMIFVLNMIDLLEDQGRSLRLEDLRQYLDLPVLAVSVRNRLHMDDLLAELKNHLHDPKPDRAPLYILNDTERFVASRLQKKCALPSLYMAKVTAHHSSWLSHLSAEEKQFVEEQIDRSGFHNLHLQVKETMGRFDAFTPVVKKIFHKSRSNEQSLTEQLDRWVTHRIMGPVLFFMIMLFVFQSIFTWAEYPMEMIETFFAFIGEKLSGILSKGVLADLIVNGLLAGLAGVVVFVPQIAILFFLISLLEESGYMSRVVFMFDHLLRRFGMNGRSMVALISSGACAIPAIMSTRTITHPGERLVTILVSPLISCSARLPVYAVLVGFVVPEGAWLGLFDYRGIAMMVLYLLGITGALAAAWISSKLIRVEGASFLMIELPNYQAPIWKNVIIVVWEKVTSFLVNAGKIIIVISIALWFLASYGPGNDLQQAETSARSFALEKNLTEDETAHHIASARIESSYIGQLGKWFEPAIAPLGFDWKMGIAILTSFAAREVFVGTMSTIYSLGSDADEKTLRQKMAAEINPDTGKPVYQANTAASLLVFYVFAMQCMSTLAVTRKETGSWKWPFIQFTYMGILAYIGALLAYNLF